MGRLCPRGRAWQSSYPSMNEILLLHAQAIGLPGVSSAFLPRTTFFLVTSVSLMVCCLSYGRQLVIKKICHKDMYKVVRSSFVKQSFSSPHSWRFMQL